MSAGDTLKYDKSSSATKSPSSANGSDIHTSVVLCSSGYQHILEDENGKIIIWLYSDFEEGAQLQRAMREFNFVINSEMPGKSSKMTMQQHAKQCAKMPENRVVQKYKSSTQTHGESMQSVLLQDDGVSTVSEEELAAMLPNIAEAISKMEHTEAREILPGITQSITKLKNGGNLVITTMTRKLNEEDDESSGQRSPELENPGLEVDNLENSQIYLVKDLKGDLFYVKDITSETPESAYFSSSRTTSECVSDRNSPSCERISEIHSVGNCGIKESTAEEIINAMYGGNNAGEITDNEEEWNERTNEYDIPRRSNTQSQKGYSKDIFNTSYMVEEPEDSLPRSTEVTDKPYSPFTMTSGTPLQYNGDMAQWYSQMAGAMSDDAYSISAVSTQNTDTGPSKTIERYTIETEMTDYPLKQTAYGLSPPPMSIPPLYLQDDIPQYSLVKVDMIPKQQHETTDYPLQHTNHTVPQLPMFILPDYLQANIPQHSLLRGDMTPKQQHETAKIQTETDTNSEHQQKPIYKTVAHIQTTDKLPLPKHVANKNKRHKIITSNFSEEQESHMSFDEIDYKSSVENIEHKTSYPTLAKTNYNLNKSTNSKPKNVCKIIIPKALEEEEVQESHMSFDEIDYTFSVENIGHKASFPTVAKTNYNLNKSTKSKPKIVFRTEKRIEIGKNTSTDQRFKTEIEVNDTKPETVEESAHSYNEINASLAQSDSNTRVVRGSYLIKNSLDDVDKSQADNINMFDGRFTLSKDNPLYQSNENMYRKSERERSEHVRRQDGFTKEQNPDVIFETVDRFSKSKTVKHEPVNTNQTITQLLLERLSTIDQKDIRQHIDVKHHSEDIYGDPKLMHADGESSNKTVGTSDFDTVAEKVDLMVKNGKAFIIVKVTAERITPVDREFNIWRKNQAIVTRTIEVDLLATEHRRRFYYQIMEEPDIRSRGSNSTGSSETVLDSYETLELFTKILGAAGGEGDTEDIEVKTRSGNTTRPFSSGMDMLF